MCIYIIYNIHTHTYIYIYIYIYTYITINIYMYLYVYVFLYSPAWNSGHSLKYFKTLNQIRKWLVLLIFSRLKNSTIYILKLKAKPLEPFLYISEYIKVFRTIFWKFWSIGWFLTYQNSWEISSSKSMTFNRGFWLKQNHHKQYAFIMFSY